MVVQLSSVDPLKIRELKAAAGKYAYSSRIKCLHIDDKTQVVHFESIATRAITKNRNDISRPPVRLRQTLTFVFRHFHRISFQRGQYSIVILKLLD